MGERCPIGAEDETSHSVLPDEDGAEGALARKWTVLTSCIYLHLT